MIPYIIISILVIRIFIILFSKLFDTNKISEFIKKTNKCDSCYREDVELYCRKCYQFDNKHESYSLRFVFLCFVLFLALMIYTFSTDPIVGRIYNQLDVACNNYIPGTKFDRLSLQKGVLICFQEFNNSEGKKIIKKYQFIKGKCSAYDEVGIRIEC